MRTLVALIMAMAIIGCGKIENTTVTGEKNAGKTEVKPKLQPTQVTARQVVEGMTGKTAVDQGKKAQDKIRAISADENKKLNEVMDGK